MSTVFGSSDRIRSIKARSRSEFNLIRFVRKVIPCSYGTRLRFEEAPFKVSWFFEIRA